MKQKCSHAVRLRAGLVIGTLFSTKKRIFVRCDVIAKRTNDYFRVCFICKKSMTGVSISARYSGMVKSFADVLPAMSYFRLKEGEHKLGV